MWVLPMKTWLWNPSIQKERNNFVSNGIRWFVSIEQPIQEPTAESMMMMMPNCFRFAVMAWLGWLSLGGAAGDATDRDAAGKGDRRSLREIITTTACPNIRTAASDYPARLDLIYVYSLEYYNDDDNNDGDSLLEDAGLPGIERAIATSVASALNSCGVANQPSYAVEISDYSAHRLATTDESGICQDRPTDANTRCNSVRGVTSILLESSVAGLDSLVFTLIDTTLQDILFLRQYSSTNLTRAEFERSIGGSLVLLTSDEDSRSGKESNGIEADSSSGNVKVAVVAAMLSFSLSAVLMYVLYRKSKAHGRDSTLALKDRIARVQAKRRQYFQQLEEDQPSLEPGWMVTDAALPTHPTMTWSDLTSDSESIISTLPLDRIDEEVGSNGDGENNGEEVEVSLSEIGSTKSDIGSSPNVRHMSPMHIEHLAFIAQWNDQTGGSEVASYTDEEKAESNGHFDDAADSESIEMCAVEPFWLDEDQTPLASNRITEGTTATTELLAGCEFVYDHDEPNGCKTFDESDSLLLELSSEDEEGDENAAPIPKAVVGFGDAAADQRSKLQAPLSDLTNATIESSPTNSDSSAALDPKLADWARELLQKLTTGGVQLLTCGAEDETK